MTSGQHFDYDALALEALRGVVKACLEQVSREGLLGDHHFYIAFNTQAPGVNMSKRLKEKYPVEMTIVLQHRFWGLVVSDDRFEVKLTFDGIPELLVVPFKAVKVFYDPSVPYILQFEDFEAMPGSAPQQGPRRVPDPVQDVAQLEAEPADTGSDMAGRPRPTRKSRTEADADDTRPDVAASTPSRREHGTQRLIAPPAASPVDPGKPALATVATSEREEGSDEAEQSPADDEEAASGSGGAKIFDLSKFRGKK